MRFFFDNCMSPCLARGMNELIQQDGHEARHLRGKFRSDEKDEHWIVALGKEGGWVIISGDTGITRSPHLRQLWRESELTAFFLGKAWGSLQRWEQVCTFVRWWPGILRLARDAKRGDGFILHGKRTFKAEKV